MWSVVGGRVLVCFVYTDLGRRIGSEGGRVGSRSPSSVWKICRFNFRVSQYNDFIVSMYRSRLDVPRHFAGRVFFMVLIFDVCRFSRFRFPRTCATGRFLRLKRPLPGNRKSLTEGFEGFSVISKDSNDQIQVFMFSDASLEVVYYFQNR